MAQKKLSIVIPVFNEERTINLILDRIKEVNLIYGITKEIIIVNDCSTDETNKAIESYLDKNPALNIQYFKQEINKGKGAALHVGITKATGDYLIIQDADLEYDPQDYNKLLIPIVNGFADVVYGSRFLGAKSHNQFSFLQLIGNRFLSSFSNIFTNLKLTDMESCYKLIKTDILRQIDLLDNNFGIEPEITCKISRIKNIKVCEVPISYYGRTYKDGKKITWVDGVRSIYCIFKYGFFKL